MTILLTVFFFNVIAAFVNSVVGHSFWCGVNIVLAVLSALWAIAYEGRQLSRIKALEDEMKLFRKESRNEIICSSSGCSRKDC